MESNDSSSISFSIFEANLDDLLLDKNFPIKEKPALDISTTDYDLDNNKYLKNRVNRKFESFISLYNTHEEEYFRYKRKIDYSIKKISQNNYNFICINNKESNQSHQENCIKNQIVINNSIEKNPTTTHKLNQCEYLISTSIDNTPQPIDNIQRYINLVSNDKERDSDNNIEAEISNKHTIDDKKDILIEPDCVKLISKIHNTYLKENQELYITSNENINQLEKIKNSLNNVVENEREKENIYNFIESLLENILEIVISTKRPNMSKKNFDLDNPNIYIKNYSYPDENPSKNEKILKESKNSKNTFRISRKNIEIINDKYYNNHYNPNHLNNGNNSETKLLLLSKETVSSIFFPQTNLIRNNKKEKINYLNEYFIEKKINLGIIHNEESFCIKASLNTNYNQSTEKNISESKGLIYKFNSNIEQYKDIHKSVINENNLKNCKFNKKLNRDNQDQIINISLKNIDFNSQFVKEISFFLINNKDSKLKENTLQENHLANIESVNIIQNLYYESSSQERIKQELNRIEYKEETYNFNSKINLNTDQEQLENKIQADDDSKKDHDINTESENYMKMESLIEEYNELMNNKFVNNLLSIDKRDLDNKENIEVFLNNISENENLNYSNNLLDLPKKIYLNTRGSIMKNKKYFLLNKEIKSPPEISNFPVINDNENNYILADNKENIFSFNKIGNYSDESKNISNNISIIENSNLNHSIIEEVCSRNLDISGFFGKKQGNIIISKQEISEDKVIRHSSDLKDNNLLQSIKENSYFSNIHLSNNDKLNRLKKGFIIGKSGLNIIGKRHNQEKVNIIDSQNKLIDLENKRYEKNDLKVITFNFSLGENQNRINQSSLGQHKKMKVIIENKINIDITKDSDKNNDENNQDMSKEMTNQNKHSSNQNYSNNTNSTSKYKFSFSKDKNYNLAPKGFYNTRNTENPNSPLSIFFKPNCKIPSNLRSNKILRINSTNIKKKPRLVIYSNENHLQSITNEEKDSKDIILDNEDEYTNQNYFQSETKSITNHPKKENIQLYFDNNLKKNQMDMLEAKRFIDNFSLNTNNTDREESTTPRIRILKSSSGLKKFSQKIPANNKIDNKEYQQIQMLSHKLNKKIPMWNRSLTTKGNKFHTLLKGNMENRNSKNKQIIPLKNLVYMKDQNINIKKVIDIQYPKINSLRNRNPYI